MINEKENNKLKNNIFSKKIYNNNNINKSYAINYKNNISNENSILKENDENNLSSKRILKDSLSKKKNIKYNDIDLNNLFSKSSKKTEKNKFIKLNINKFEEENGGNIKDFYEKENKKSENLEEKESINNENNYENKFDLKEISISDKRKKGKNQIEITENNSEENIDNDNNNELINMNKHLINKITELKREMEFTRKEMIKKDKKLLIYVNKYDKIATENVNNMAEIENLEEELLNKQDEMDFKTKKIKELTNKNIDLEKEMKKLKVYYKKKENFIYNKKSNKNENKDNNKSNNSIEEKNEKEICEKFQQLEENINYENFSIDELHNERNALIKERNEKTLLYDKLPIKLVTKEQINLKAELEKDINIINNKLMKIRLQIKSYNL